MPDAISSNLQMQFRKPLKFAPAEEKRAYRNYVLRKAIRWMVLSFTAIILLYWLDLFIQSFGVDTHSSQRARSVDIFSLLALGCVLAFLYGFLHLLLLRPKMTELARQNLLSVHPELRALEDKRLKAAAQQSELIGKVLIVLLAVAMLIVIGAVMIYSEHSYN